MSRYYVTGSEARALRRLSRRVSGVSLEPVDTCTIEPLGHKWNKRDAICMESIRNALGLGCDRRISLRVPAPAYRLRSSCVCSSVCSVKLPKGSFLRLDVSNESVLSIPDDAEVYVDSPQLSFATASHQLDGLVARQAMQSYEADIRLVAMAAEECGHYAFNPWKPRGGNCMFELPEIMTVDSLTGYLNHLQGFDGMARAKRAASLAFDRSDSPMETFVNAGMSMPVTHGGLFLGSPVANKQINLSDLQKLMLNHRDHITPDLLWEAWSIIVEYLGREPHEGQPAQDEDMGRVQDYQVLGYLVFPITYKHVHNPQSFNELAVRIAAAMEQKGLFGAGAQLALLLSDQAFLERQSCLFKVMLPPVARD